METGNLASYQHPREDTPSHIGEDEAKALLVGYGSVDRCGRDVPDTPFDPATDFPLDNENASPATVGGRKKRFQHWRTAGLAVVFYVCVTGAVVWYRNRDSTLLSPMSSEQVVNNVEILGKSKKAKPAKSETKPPKAAEVEKKQVVAATFEPTPYPGCLTVEVKYVKTPLPFEDHELAANASGCHLASIHSLVENTKLSAGGLFAMSIGPEIGMAFASGKVLAKEFWLGAYNLDGNVSDPWIWTDDSPWDFGPVGWDNATKGCLASTINFTEIHFPAIPVEGHYIAEECLMALPAIYKCCTTYAPPSAYPSATPSIEPSEEPSEKPSETPTAGPTDYPSEYPTHIPTDMPTGGPTNYPSEEPTPNPTEPPTAEPTDTPSGPPTNGPSKFPTESPTVPPTDWPTEDPTEFPTSYPTAEPTEEPTFLPTPRPTKARRTHKPTPAPSLPLETESPTILPTRKPRKVPKTSKTTTKTTKRHTAVGPATDEVHDPATVPVPSTRQ